MPPDEVCWNAAISACGKAPRDDILLIRFSKHSQGALEASIFLTHRRTQRATFAWLQASRWEPALALLFSMSARALRANEISSLGNRRRAAELESLEQAMSFFPLNPPGFNSAITACEKKDSGLLSSLYGPLILLLASKLELYLRCHVLHA